MTPRTPVWKAPGTSNGVNAPALYRKPWNNPDDEYEPDFSPNGHKIVYSVGGDSLWVVGASGKNPHKILDVSNDTPTWSPSGDRIAFAEGDDIVTVLPDGSGRVNVTTGGSAGDNIDWQTK